MDRGDLEPGDRVHEVSAGCDHCYAETFAERWRGIPGHPYEQGFDLRFWPERLDQPLRWRTPRVIFVNSMSDLFHQRVPASYVDRVLDTIRKTPRHTYQVLTKRPGKMASVMHRLQPEPLPNLWLGTSVEDDPQVGRVDYVRRTPAAVRFLSLEPLLGPVPSLDLAGVDWVIVGGESGPRHRPIDPSWVRAIRDRCVSEGVAFFFKQWGGRTPKAGGRELDGRTWDEMPAATRTAVPA